jgi:hypothetical protein
MTRVLFFLCPENLTGQNPNPPSLTLSLFLFKQSLSPPMIILEKNGGKGQTKGKKLQQYLLFVLSALTSILKI